MAHFPALNSWIILNLPDGNPSIVTGKLRILFVAAVVIATAFSVTRLLPKRWTMLKRPLHERTWPSILVCLLVLVSWYSVSASPYRIPLFGRAVFPELTLLHVEKRGLQFHEKTITVYRDGRLYVAGNARRLFQYRFTVRGSEGTLPEYLSGRVRIQCTAARRPVKLGSWEAEGWFVRTRQGIAAFTSENGSMPPQNVVAMFRELESVTPGDKQLGSLKDICLGFCYDPLAGLGLQYLNSRYECMPTPPPLPSPPPTPSPSRNLPPTSQSPPSPDNFPAR